MNELFKFHELNEDGKKSAVAIAEAFDELIAKLNIHCIENNREFSICKTKLEEACFFAKKAMAVVDVNQK